MLPTLMGTAMFKEEWLFLALVVELLIDEAYVIHSLLSTPPTTVLGHTAFLLPIIFSIYSVRTFETIRKRKIPVVVDNIWRVVGYATVMASALLGYVVISFEVQEGICVAELGDRRCSWPKVYWPQGIFSGTSRILKDQDTDMHTCNQGVRLCRVQAHDTPSDNQHFGQLREPYPSGMARPSDP